VSAEVRTEGVKEGWKAVMKEEEEVERSRGREVEKV